MRFAFMFVLLSACLSAKVMPSEPQIEVLKIYSMLFQRLANSTDMEETKSVAADDQIHTSNTTLIKETSIKSLTLLALSALNRCPTYDFTVPAECSADSFIKNSNIRTVCIKAARTFVTRIALCGIEDYIEKKVSMARDFWPLVLVQPLLEPEVRPLVDAELLHTAKLLIGNDALLQRVLQSVRALLTGTDNSVAHEAVLAEGAQCVLDVLHDIFFSKQQRADASALPAVRVLTGVSVCALVMRRLAFLNALLLKDSNAMVQLPALTPEIVYEGQVTEPELADVLNAFSIYRALVFAPKLATLHALTGSYKLDERQAPSERCAAALTDRASSALIASDLFGERQSVLNVLKKHSELALITTNFMHVVTPFSFTINYSNEPNWHFLFDVRMLEDSVILSIDARKRGLLVVEYSIEDTAALFVRLLNSSSNSNNYAYLKGCKHFSLQRVADAHSTAPQSASIEQLLKEQHMQIADHALRKIINEASIQETHGKLHIDEIIENTNIPSEEQQEQQINDFEAQGKNAKFEMFKEVVSVQSDTKHADFEQPLFQPQAEAIVNAGYKERMSQTLQDHKQHKHKQPLVKNELLQAVEFWQRNHTVHGQLAPTELTLSLSSAKEKTVQKQQQKESNEAVRAKASSRHRMGIEEKHAIDKSNEISNSNLSDMKKRSKSKHKFNEKKKKQKVYYIIVISIGIAITLISIAAWWGYVCKRRGFKVPAYMTP